MKAGWLMITVITVPAVAVMGQESTGAECEQLSETRIEKLSRYVAGRYELAPDVLLEAASSVGATCFRRLIFRGANSARTYELYLSPDLRFLSDTLFDTEMDPASERLRVARQTQSALLADASPTKGATGSPVTVVVFSDFQCSFCKRLADLLSHPDTPELQETRVVFKHRPLPMHNWARPAALATICANFQGDHYFWELHDRLFSNQSVITPQTLHDTIAGFMEQAAGLRVDEYRRCLADSRAEGVLVRDEALAATYRVDATPTMFINGVRKVGFASPDEVLSALKSAVLMADRNRGRAAR
jgi:protein-disulfide isomerase